MLPEPERFYPERFNEDEKAKRHQYVYFPFEEDPRICISKFAFLYVVWQNR
jgi:cytochrome P450